MNNKIALMELFDLVKHDNGLENMSKVCKCLSVLFVLFCYETREP